MLTLAIAIAFVLAFTVAPAKFFAGGLVVAGLGSSFWEQAFIGLMLGYVIPAVVVYLALNWPPIRAHIVLSGKTLWALRICNGVSIAYVIARLLAALVPGGGAGYLIGSFAIVTLAPAALVSMGALFQICGRSFGTRGRIGAAIGIVLLLATPFLRWSLQESRLDTVWDETCKRAGDRFVAQLADFKLVQFQGMGHLPVYASVQGQAYGSMTRENVGEALMKRGLLREYEDVNPQAQRAPKRVYFANGVQEEPLTNSQATHVVTLSRPPELNGNSMHKYQTFRVVITDARTGGVVAERTVLNDLTDKKRVCGSVYEGRVDTSDFVAKALNLQPAAKS